MAEVDFSPLMVNPLAQQKQAYSYADMIGQNAAKYQAGQQYAAGDYSGASKTQAQAGNIDQAQAIDQQGQKSAEAVHAYITQALPVFQKILQVHASDPDGGKQAIAQAFDSVAPEISQLTGHNDQALATLRQNLVSDPQGTLSRIQAMVPVKYSNVAPGSTVLRQQGNEAPQPVYTQAPKAPDGFTGDPQTGYHYVPGGPADPALRKQYKEDARNIIIQNPVPGQGGGAVGEAVSLSPEGLSNQVDTYIASRGAIMPSFGFGKQGKADRDRFYNELASSMKEQNITAGDIASGKAEYKANAASLTQVSKMRNSVESYEQTVQKNMDLLSTLLDKGAAKGSAPVINRWIQAGRASIQGDPDVTAYNTAIQTVVNEYAKVMAGGTGSSAASSDSARAEAGHLLNTAQTPQQVKAAIQTMRAEMSNRIEALKAQEGDLKKRLGSSGGSEPAPSKVDLKAKYGLD